jgi:hypothetical protein
MIIELVELDKLAMALGSMINTKACKNFHATTTTEGSKCKIFKQHWHSKP